MKLTIRSLSGAKTITGSKRLIDAGRTRVLVDCGTFSGVDSHAGAQFGAARRGAKWKANVVDPLFGYDLT